MASTYNAGDEEVKRQTVEDITRENISNNNIKSSNNNNNIRRDDADKIKKGPLPGAPPDGGWGWVVVVASFFVSVLVDGVCFSFGIFFDEFRNEFGTSKATTSWIGSVLNGSYLTFGPIISALVNLYGCRKMTLFGAVLAFVSFFASTFSQNIGVLIFTYGFLGGLGFGCMYLPAIVMVGYYFERRRALATGIACCGSGIGAFLFAPLTEYLLQEYGWRGAHWILSALVFHGVVCAIFYRPLARVEVKADESLKLLEPPPSEPGHGILDMTNVMTSPRVQNEGEKRPVSDELRAQIYERLRSDQNVVPIYRTRSMTLGSPELTKPGHNQPVPSGLARLAFSQDFSIHHRRRKDTHRWEHSHKDNMLPLQRQDIFYSGSLWHLKEYQEVDSVDEYRRKVTEKADVGGAGATSSDKKSFIQSFVSVFDISLLKSPTFLIYGASCFLCMAGFFVPFMYMPTHAIDLGLDTTRAAFLISIIGITNTVGRVAVGFISDQPWADCLLINNVALICGGIATIFVPYYPEYYLLAIYSAVFGTAIAVFVSLRSIIMVELMGLEKLTTAFGFVIMCQGVSSFLGPPLAGAMSDSTGNYNAAFYLAGVALTLSGVICLPLRRIATWETKKKAQISTKGNLISNRLHLLEDVIAKEDEQKPMI